MLWHHSRLFWTNKSFRTIHFSLRPTHNQIPTTPTTERGNFLGQNWNIQLFSNGDMLGHYSHLFSTEKLFRTTHFSVKPSRNQIPTTHSYQAWEFLNKIWSICLFGNGGMLGHYSHLFSTHKSVRAIHFSLRLSDKQIPNMPTTSTKRGNFGQHLKYSLVQQWWHTWALF